MTVVGRKLSGRAHKWHTYHRAGATPVLRTGTSDTLVVVEDVASACVVAQTYPCLSLLSTSMSIEDLTTCLGYGRILVCLDPDAYSKCVQIAQRVGPLVGYACAIRIPNDLKYFTPAEVKGILECSSQWKLT